jgi:hypothetical protein
MALTHMCRRLGQQGLKAFPNQAGGGSTGAADFWGITGTTGNCIGLGQYRLYIDHQVTSCYVSSNSLAPNTWSYAIEIRILSAPTTAH